jgi:hypothetical protein
MKIYHDRGVDAILLFTKDLYINWIFAMTGTIIAVVLTLHPLFNVSLRASTWVMIIGTYLALFFASFQAWRKQYNRAGSALLALDEIYADIVLYELKSSIKTSGAFSAEAMAERVGIDAADAVRGLELLRDKYQAVEGGGSSWSYVGEKAILLNARFCAVSSCNRTIAVWQKVAQDAQNQS